MFKECMEQVRRKGPLIHNITNYVTVNDVANIILACGGSPIMADDQREVEEITAICQGLTINIGTLNERIVASIHLAGKMAGKLGHAIVFDPVGAGASRLRTETAEGIINAFPITAIRGNISEIRALALGSGNTKGVDADVADTVTEENLDCAIDFVRRYAGQTGGIIAVTGKIDLVGDRMRCYVIRNGRSEMGRITGTGCQLSGMMTAYLAANPGRELEAAAAAVCAMGLAGEIGYSHMKPEDGNSTYRNRIIDAICHLDGETLERRANYELRE